MLCCYKEFFAKKNIILASTSERRKELLEKLGIKFKVLESPYNEEQNRSLITDPHSFAKFTANKKASALLNEQIQNYEAPNIDIVIGADTIIYHNGKILGKPKNPDHASEMLKSLSGTQHEVITGLSLHYKNKNGLYQEKLISETTRVKFSKLSAAVIHAYVETGEPLDKAGSYGIQGVGGSLIEGIEGDFYNVVGFPIHRFCVEMINIFTELEESQHSRQNNEINN